MVIVHLTSGETAEIDGAETKDIRILSDRDRMEIRSRYGEMLLFRWSAVSYVEATSK